MGTFENACTITTRALACGDYDALQANAAASRAQSTGALRGRILD